MTDTEFRDAIKKGRLSGGYLLFGDEDFLKERYAGDMCHAVCGGQFEEFNIIKADAAETSATALEESLAMYPMMSEKKSVLLQGFQISALKEKELETYIDVFSRISDYPHTVLAVSVPGGAFDAGNLPKRPSAVYKKLTANLTPVQFDLKGPAALKKWITAQLKTTGAEVHPDTPEVMLGRCGRDMNILHGECEKLTAYAAANGADMIVPDMVELVCCKSEEEDAFALANAVVAGDRKSALAALQGYRDRKEEPVAVTAALGRVICDMLHVCILQSEGMTKSAIASALKMHEYKCSLYMQAVKGVEPARLRAAMERCHDTDKLLKSTDLKYIAVERLICTIPAKRR